VGFVTGAEFVVDGGYTAIWRRYLTRVIARIAVIGSADDGILRALRSTLVPALNRSLDPSRNASGREKRDPADNLYRDSRRVAAMSGEQDLIYKP